MAPIGPTHADVVDWLNLWSMKNLPEAVGRVRVQNPLALETTESEPEPDIVWVRPKRFRTKHPRSRDVLLLIEVAESSLEFDQDEKSSLYARAGIRDYWIVNLIDKTIEVRREPRGGRCRSVRSFGGGEIVQPLATPKAQLSVDALFDQPN